jgi:hypothetical protein
MAVIRQRRQNIASNIGVIRADTGATQSWAKVGELADTFIENSFNDLKRIAKEKGIETAQAASAADLRVIDPVTGDIKAFTIPDGFGTVAQEAYKEIVEARYLKQTETEFKNKASEIAIKFQFDSDPVGMFSTEFGKYIDESAKNTSPRFAQAIENLGNSLLASNKMSLMQDKIIRDRKDQASDIELSVGEARKNIKAMASSLNYNDVTQGDIDKIIAEETALVQNGVDSNLFTEDAGNLYIKELKASQYSGLAQRIMSTIADDPAMTSDDVTKVRIVIRSRGVGLDELPEKLQPLVKSFVENKDFYDFQDGLIQDLTGGGAELSKLEQSKRQKETDKDRQDRENAEDAFLIAQAGIPDDEQSAFDNILAKTSVGDFDDAISLFEDYTKLIDQKQKIYTEAGRSTSELFRSQTRVRQNLLFDMMRSAVHSGSNNEYQEAIALGEYLESNGARGQLNEKQKPIADKIIALHDASKDRTYVRREMEGFLKDVKPSAPTALDSSINNIVNGGIANNTTTDRKAADAIVVASLPENLQNDSLPNVLITTDVTNPSAELVPAIRKAEELLSRGIVPNSISTMFNGVSTGSITNPQLIINAVNMYKKYSNFLMPNGDLQNVLSPSVGKGVSQDAMAIMETVVQITSVQGVEDISQTLSNVIANARNPAKIENGLSRMFAGKFTDVKRSETKLKKYLNTKFGSNLRAHDMFSPIIETMAANDHSYDDINNKVTDLYNDFYAETKGLVIDTNSGTTNKSPYAIDRVFPDPDFKTAFIVAAQEKISQETDGGFVISEHFYGEAERKVSLVPYPDQSISGGAVRYIAHHVKNGQLVPLLGDDGPIVISSDIANEEINNIQNERKLALIEANKPTPRQIRVREEEARTGKKIDQTQSLEAEAYIGQR